LQLPLGTRQGSGCKWPHDFSEREDSMSTAETVCATQYLTYKLGEEVFALDIRKVREVLDFTTVTKVPRTPDFMRGVINLRGVWSR
jgi:chemotaxis signal transduction protein